MTERLSLLVLNHTYLLEELRALGAKVFSVGWSRGSMMSPFDLMLPDKPFLSLDELLSYLPSEFSPNRLLYFDNSEFPRISGVENAPFPTLFYSVDAHIHASWHRFWGGAFDAVLCAQSEYLTEYQKINGSAKWFPLWPFELHEPSGERSLDVSFRGNFSPGTHPSRTAFFEELDREIGRFGIQADFGSGEYAELYQKSKIVINHALKRDVNFRVFEGISCGALMLTPSNGSGLSELFTPGEHLVTYEDGSVKSAAEMLRYFLTHDDERLAISKQGFEHLQRHHTASARALRLFALLETLEKTNLEKRSLFSAIAYLHNFRAFPTTWHSLRATLLRAAAECLVSYRHQGGAPCEEFEALQHALTMGFQEMGAMS